MLENNEYFCAILFLRETIHKLLHEICIFTHFDFLGIMLLIVSKIATLNIFNQAGLRFILVDINVLRMA
jgi:hypothetical protein